MFFAEVARVLQSYQKFNLSIPVFVNVVHISVPKGGNSKRRSINATEFIANKSCIVSISSYDELCYARSIVVRKAVADGLPTADKKHWASLIWKDSVIQTRRVMSANVPLTAVAVDRIEKFLPFIPGYRIIIYNKPFADSIIYESPLASKKINLLLHESHFSVIRALVPFLGKKRCENCHAVTVVSSKHRCTRCCFVCSRVNCVLEKARNCAQCNREFNNRECYEAHLKLKGKQSFCETNRVCAKCDTMCNTRKKRINGVHHCGEHWCRNCSSLVLPDHDCFIRQYDHKPKQTPKIRYCDFECDFSDGTHRPIAAVAMTDDGLTTQFHGEATQELFCAWLFTEQHRVHILLFHNMSSYDGMFLLHQYAVNRRGPGGGALQRHGSGARN